MASPKRSAAASLGGRPILVAGKSGQLACCLHDVASQRNASLVSVGRPDLDLENGASIDDVVAAIRPSAIINAAAYTAVDRAEKEPECAYMINRDGAARLAAAAKRRGIPFIHISTDYVFDGHKPSPYDEGDTAAPLNVYGRSKLEGEIAVLDAYPGALVMRTSWLYSPYGHNFLRTMLRLSVAPKVVPVVNDQRGTPTSALDLAGGILEIARQLADHSVDGSGISHLAGQGEATWFGFAESIFTSLGRRGQPVPGLQEITTEEYPTPACRPKNSCLDSSRTERIFRVRLAPWQASLERCLDRLAIQMEFPAC